MPLQLDNRTPFACKHPPMLARNGAGILRIIVRATYDIEADGSLAIAAEQAPVRFEDEYWGEAGKSALRYESDVSLDKPMTDLIVNGQAHAPSGRPAPHVDVTVTFAERTLKRLRVFGDRRWDHGVSGWRITPAARFESVPITYDRAFGGMDDAGSEPRNRVGTGYTSKLTSAFAGTPLPNVEDPAALIDAPKDRPAPAGLGIVSRDWQQRLRFAGTYDQAWLQQRMPLLPDDFDMHFNQSTPEEQWLRRPRGGESVRIVGMTAQGALSFRMPSGELKLGLYYKKRSLELAMPLECILVDCERRQVELTWRASADVHGDPFQLQTMVLSTNSTELALRTPCC